MVFIDPQTRMPPKKPKNIVSSVTNSMTSAGASIASSVKDKFKAPKTSIKGLFGVKDKSGDKGKEKEKEKEKERERVRWDDDDDEPGSSKSATQNAGGNRPRANTTPALGSSPHVPSLVGGDLKLLCKGVP